MTAALMEKAPPGLHDACERLVDTYLDRSWKILDIATGTGAMALRLKRKGYIGIHANDIDRRSFGASEIERFTSVDCNSDFAEAFGGDFDAILAIEIIEHVENPLHFLRQCWLTLKPGGILLLTTPNVMCADSLLLWLRRGTLLYFSAADYTTLGHISVLPHWLIDGHLRTAGFDTIYSGFTDRLIPPAGGLVHRASREVALRATELVLRLAGRGGSAVDGTNYTVVVRRPCAACSAATT
jgi:SAM-dependent methyltransferase